MRIKIVAKDDVKIPVDEHWKNVKKGDEFLAEMSGGLVCIKFDVGDNE